MSDIASKLRELADEIESEEKDESALAELENVVAGVDIYDVEAEGYDCISDYVIVPNGDVGVESRNITSLSQLEGYVVEYVAWGDMAELPESGIEICVSEVDE